MDTCWRGRWLEKRYNSMNQHIFSKLISVKGHILCYKLKFIGKIKPNYITIYWVLIFICIFTNTNIFEYIVVPKAWASPPVCGGFAPYTLPISHLKYSNSHSLPLCWRITGCWFSFFPMDLQHWALLANLAAIIKCLNHWQVLVFSPWWRTCLFTVKPCLLVDHLPSNFYINELESCHLYINMLSFPTLLDFGSLIFSQCWGWKPGPHACLASTLPWATPAALVLYFKDV